MPGISPNLGDGYELLDGGWAAALAGGQNLTTQTVAAKAGASATGATQINPNTAFCYISTVASATDSIKLPAAKKGLIVMVLNCVASNAPNIYPFTTADKIGATATGSPYQGLSGTKSAVFFCPADGFWGVVLTA